MTKDDSLREEFARNGNERLSVFERNFNGRNLSGSDLSDSDIGSVSFRGCDLRGATFSRADVHADFTDADLRGARMDADTFHGSDFTRANCAGCDFGNADLDNADLLETDLRGADLSGVTGVREKEFLRAVRDESTIPPTEFAQIPNRVAAWEQKAARGVRLSSKDARIFEEETGRPYPNPTVG